MCFLLLVDFMFKRGSSSGVIQRGHPEVSSRGVIQRGHPETKMFKYVVGYDDGHAL
jgi:hypothetical protein